MTGTATVTVPAFQVAVSAGATVTGTRYTVNGLPRDSCNFSITASATGGAPGDYALWSYAVQFWTLTSSGATLSNTDYNLTAWFGSDRVTASHSVTAYRYAYWSGPFTLAITFYYTMPSLENRASTFFLTCL
jgi:hypothetical protein